MNASRFRRDRAASVHVRCDDLVEEALELAIGERDAIEGFELLPEVCFKRGAIADVGAIFVLEVP